MAGRADRHGSELGVEFSVSASERFQQQASDFFFEKLSLEEAPRSIPGATLESTCQVAFDACSGLVETELGILVRRTQDNKRRHEAEPTCDSGSARRAVPAPAVHAAPRK